MQFDRLHLRIRGEVKEQSRACMGEYCEDGTAVNPEVLSSVECLRDVIQRLTDALEQAYRPLVEAQQ